MPTQETEIVVVGSGPGGATVARELSLRGHRVLLIEKGRDSQRPLGNLRAMRSVTQFIRSAEGGIMARGVTTGGSSVVFNGNAFDPPPWLEDEYGIDLSNEVHAVKKELGITPLPESFYQSWKGTSRLVQGAAELNIELAPQNKFINPALCKHGCDDCMMGCKHGAKWTTRTYIQDAVDSGARLLTDCTVTRIIAEKGQARAVQIRDREGQREISADRIILAAGGIGTPIILINSGIKNAGQGFFVDPMNVCMGIGPDRGTTREMSFSVASQQFIQNEGFMLGNVGGRTVLGAQLIRKGSRYKSMAKLLRYPRFIGMFTKISDSPSGHVTADGKVSKPYNKEDREKFQRGTALCKKILIQAGCDPTSILVAEDLGGHPGGTAALGKVVDENLETELKGLYVCDASVFPRSLGCPPTLTILAMARWFTRRLFPV